VVFNNSGLVRKTSGTNSVFGVPFNNQNGSIEVDNGVLSLGSSSYVQGGGALTVRLSGTNAGQFGQLSAARAALAGPLNVELAAGFTPPLGSHYQILSCASLQGIFNGLGVPGGMAISYSNNGVFLVVTGALTLSAPTIVSQPASVRSTPGGGAVFSAVATGAAPLSWPVHNCRW
jgi:hypothetical protein